MQITLKDIFVLTSYCALIAWYATWTSANPVLFWIPLAIVLALSVAFVGLAQDDRGRHVALLVPIPFALFCTPYGSLSVLLNCGLLFLLGIYCAWRPPLSVRRLVGGAMACSAVALLFGALVGSAEVRHLYRLRQNYPIESLASRLTYENASDVSGVAVPKLTPGLRSRLTVLESTLDRRAYRRRQLEALHSDQYVRFVRTAGFGVSRMLRVSEESLALPPLEDVAFDDSSASETSKENPWGFDRGLYVSSAIEDFHYASEADFFDPQGFGAVLEPRTRVTGFVEHAFHSSPHDAFVESPPWRLVQLQLVSLLRFDTPRVYVLEYSPRMDQLGQADVETRQLDSFEASALPQLRTQTDIVSVEMGQQIRMLGSLRAARQCLDCHHVQRGELLGAFSYVLHRQDDQTAEATTKGD